MSLDMRTFLEQAQPYLDAIKLATERVRLVRETIWNGLELQHYCCCFIIHRI